MLQPDDYEGGILLINLVGIKQINDKLCVSTMVLQNKDSYPNNQANNFESQFVYNDCRSFAERNLTSISSVSSYIGAIKDAMRVGDRFALANSSYDYIRTNKVINITSGGILKFNSDDNDIMYHVFDANNMKKILEVYFE